VKHEDLSIDPLDEFEKIFKFLQLNFSEEIKNKIKETTTSTINTTHKRDARQNIKTWKDRLSKEEIGRIKEETRIVWQHFYSEEDW
jgi:aspartyl/asparaginyl beta-hydroxylase (cupin superfamily)